MGNIPRDDIVCNYTKKMEWCNPSKPCKKHKCTNIQCFCIMDSD